VVVYSKANSYKVHIKFRLHFLDFE